MGRSSTTTNESEPWAPSQPYILQGMQGAQNLYQGGVGQQYFGPSTVVPFSNQTELGLQAMEGRALQGNPFTGASTNALTDVLTRSDPYVPIAQEKIASFLDDDIGNEDFYRRTMGGEFLAGQGQNPYLDQTFNRMADQVQQRVNAQFGAAGRTRSGAHQDLLTDNLGDLANSVYGQNYERERGFQHDAASRLGQAQQFQLQAALGLPEIGAGYDQRRLQAASLAPGIAQQDYYDIDSYMQAGQTRESLANAYMQDLINRQNFSQQAPWDALGQFNNAAQGFGSLGGTSESSSKPSLWQSILGGIGAGASVLGIPGLL